MSGLYFHVPFCTRKCLYCDFCSFENLSLIDDFILAIEKELSLCDKIPGRIETLYIGGGTPSVLKEEQIERLFSVIRKRFDLSGLKETTFEANPESMDLSKARLLRSLGVDRISLGAQSFDENNLRYLGRLASYKRFTEAFEALRKAGFKNINADLIYALPGQKPQNWAEDLKKAAEFGFEHISCYCLEIHEKTPLSLQPARAREEDAETMYFMAIEKLKKAGYEQYEISNFSRPGRRSLHNMNYWQRGDYLGFGPSAASCTGNIRRVNLSSLDKYLASLSAGLPAQAFSEQLDSEDVFRERLILGLRLNDGIEYKGDIFIKFRDKLKDALEKGFLEKDGNKVRIKEKFLFVSNAVISDIAF
ncbi:MAG: radical SAM family heme chaperone HemW [Elusimicrobiota bacterium]